MTPRFSVVIPAFNAESFVAEAIGSVLAQSNANFELLLIDDGSTDRTAPIARSFGDSRIRVFSIPASGRPAVPRNFGIRQARGELIAFLDADDSWPATKLARFDECVRAHPNAGLFFSNGVVTDAASGPLHLILPESVPIEEVPPGDELLLLVNFIPLSSVVVRKVVLPERPFDERMEMRAVEDYLLWLDLNRRITFRYLPEPLFYKRMHGSNISSSSQQRDRLRCLLGTLRGRGCYSPDLLALSSALNSVRYDCGLVEQSLAFGSILGAAAIHPKRTIGRLRRLAQLSHKRSPSRVSSHVNAAPCKA